MLIAVFANYLILLALFGYSLLIKSFLLKNHKNIINNIDIFYGFLLLIFLSLYLNFFFPLKIFSEVIILIGFLLFLYGLYKKVYKINLFIYFLIVFLTTFISFYNSSNIDSPMYHLQILNWINIHKISFGLTNLEIRFGSNSSWHSFLGLMDIGINTIRSKFYLSSLLFSIAIYEVIRVKKKIYPSDIFLFLCISFLIFFSFIHPFQNGVILNHLGNPELDIVPMFLFFLIIYVFLKLDEADYTDQNLVNIFLILIFFSITSRLQGAPLAILMFYIYFSKKNYSYFNLSNFLIILTGIAWLIRSYILSGCLFFPIKSSCFDVKWSSGLDKINHLYSVIISYARDTPLRSKYMNFEYTLYSSDWISPWFKEYFLNNAFLKIGSSIIFICIFFLIAALFFKFKKLKFVISRVKLILFFVLLLNLFLWFKVPEIRFGWGVLISIPCIMLLFTILIYNIQIFFTQKIIFLSILTLLVLLTSKSFDRFHLNHLVDTHWKGFDYSQIEKIGNFEGYNFFESKNWECADFKEICVNTPKEKYIIKKNFNYIFFLNN